MPPSLDRRAFMTYCSSIGLGTTLLPGVLWARFAAGAEITKETVACAEEIAGALEMNPAIPAEVPSYWMVYFTRFSRATRSPRRCTLIRCRRA